MKNEKERAPVIVGATKRCRSWRAAWHWELIKKRITAHSCAPYKKESALHIYKYLCMSVWVLKHAKKVFVFIVFRNAWMFVCVFGYEAVQQYCLVLCHKVNDKIWLTHWQIDQKITSPLQPCPSQSATHTHIHTHSMGAFFHMHTLINQHNNIYTAHLNTVQAVIF